LKKALILGVGDAQVDIIRCLKSAGWFVIACSYRQEGRGLELCDRFERIDIVDIRGLADLAEKEKVDLVYSVGSDLALPAIARISEKLGIPTYIPMDTAERMCNKVLFRDFLSGRGISPVRYSKITNAEDIDSWDVFPAVVKPADSQGQRGVFLAGSKEDIAAGLPRALSYSKSRTAIVEEKLDGPEVSVNAFLTDSRPAFLCISDRHPMEGCVAGVPREHCLPSRQASDQAVRQTEDLILQTVRAFGIENGPVYFQLKLTRNGPRIIDATPRLDGCHLWRLIQWSTGVDLLKAGLDQLMGETAQNLTSKTPWRSGCLRFFLSPPGKTFRKADIPVPERAVHLEWYYQDGETVRPINGVVEKVGYCLLDDA